MLKILLIIFVLIIILPSVICWLMWYFTEKKNSKPQSKLSDTQMQELLSDEGLSVKEIEGPLPQSIQKEKQTKNEKITPHETQSIIFKRDIYY